MKEEKRFINYDFLRVIAAFFVILIHTNSFSLYDSTPNSLDFELMNIIGSISRFAALSFIMISGRYLLDPNKQITIKKILKKYVLRMVVSLIIFEILYTMYYYYIINHYNGLEWLKPFVVDLLRGETKGEQLWFLYEIIFLYLITPALRKFTEQANYKEFLYIIIFGIVFSIILPTIRNYGFFQSIKFNGFARDMGVYYSINYILYYLLGYFIYKYQDKFKNIKLYIFLFILSNILTISSGALLTLRHNELSLSRVYWYFSINVFINTVTIFILFTKTKMNFSVKFQKIISYISSRSFGIYLIHMFVLITVFNLFDSFNPVIKTLIISPIVFLISLILTQILSYIPFFKKYILSLDSKEKNTIDNNKIVILGLHLGFGGVENVIANTANMLCNNYDIEIVSMYKKEEEPFKINKKVKITYLMNCCSNRKEIVDNLKQKKYIICVKEIFKAILILIKKNYLLYKYINKTNGHIIISTRIEFSRLINKYKKNNVILIHQEHTYSVNESYINKLNSLNNFNYIMPVSMGLYNNYKNKVNIQLIYIPLALNYYPNDGELSKLDNKYLIAVGRLEPVKGFDDLIDVIAIVKSKIPNIKLFLYGDGSQYNILKDKIELNGLNENIIMKGFQTQSVIQKQYQNSSLYVMTSHEESFGLTVLEAMSHGIPCIAFDDIIGPKDIITDKNGFFISNRNKEEMANKIIKYLNMDKKEKNKYGKNAREETSKYQFVKVKEQWLKFIKEVR